MIKDVETENILNLIKREVVPAIGCTEPVAVAFAVAKAKEALGCIPEKIEVKLSANVLKNAMGVGIPGTDMIGLPIAVALGAIVGKSEYGLEVLKDLTTNALEQGKKMIKDKKITISLYENAPDKLYIESVCTSGKDVVKAVVSGEHTNVVMIEKNNNIIFDNRQTHSVENEYNIPELTLQKIYDFATQTPVEKLQFILESAKLNKIAAEKSLTENYGHTLGKIINGVDEKAVMGDSMFSKILSYTSSACDARMAGAMIPIMTNSGSGNQGITATMPIVVYSEETMQSEESLIRALTLSHLCVIYIKQKMGRLSALCGCVVASTGSACGITYLMGGTFEQITFAVKNMIAGLTGVICDGAKPSCSLKIAGSVSSAVFSAMMALENKFVKSVEGIIDDDVDKSIRNLTQIASTGMLETDKMILDIMVNKSV